MKTIKGNLILEKDTVFTEDITVEGNILGKEGIRYNISARDITAWDIKAGNINANNIDAGNINALDIKAVDIKAVDIKAVDIDAGDIKAVDIDAGDIKAKNISFYTFCIVYDSITCKSIKGRRENSFYKAMDGKVTIEKEGD